MGWSFRPRPQLVIKPTGNTKAFFVSLTARYGVAQDNRPNDAVIQASLRPGQVAYRGARAGSQNKTDRDQDREDQDREEQTPHPSVYEREAAGFRLPRRTGQMLRTAVSSCSTGTERLKVTPS